MLVELLKDPSVRRALFVGCGLSLFQQITGINTVMWVYIFLCNFHSLYWCSIMEQMEI